MEDSAAGYRRPPRSRQFQKGQSGNPKGRPKGVRNLKTDLDAIMEKRLPIRENGEQRLVSGRELMLLKLFEKAVAGDIRATTQIFAMLKHLDAPEQLPAQPKSVGENDRAIVADFLRRKSLSK